MYLCYNKQGDKMKIQGKTNVFEIIICKSFKRRLIGNMGRKKIDTVLLFPHCNAIHTFFMKQKIDVVMIDQNNKVLYCYPHVSPYRILLPKKGVFQVLEFPADENPYRAGDVIELEKEN